MDEGLQRAEKAVRAVSGGSAGDVGGKQAKCFVFCVCFVVDEAKVEIFLNICFHKVWWSRVGCSVCMCVWRLWME